ncbi:MAG: ATP-binding protein, partial [Planctomycetaceae bacterium]|nr:ATP-binding protein [Planctomycetaceae bacterium]
MEIRTNPFSTCNWQAGAIEYIFESEINADKILERLLLSGGVGQIVGGHGTGKSALLESLTRHLNKIGINVQKIMLNDSQKKISRDFLLSLQKRETDTIHFLDGYEQLS